MVDQLFYSNGKLLISGEYVVLDGATAFALPTKFGQWLQVSENKDSLNGCWESYNVNNECWFSLDFSPVDFAIVQTSDLKKAAVLLQILKVAVQLNPCFSKQLKGVLVKTNLNFPNEWGLGTSSTLIHNIAMWAKINPFQLLEMSFGGSGYDIACAGHDTPLLYQRNGNNPIIKEVLFDKDYIDQIHFVYLNQKMDSKQGIAMYKQLAMDKNTLVKEFSHLSSQIQKASQLKEFENLLVTHELKLSEILGIPTVKSIFFNDYTLGVVKSLGAWGGDFILVTGEKNAVNHYFTTKGYSTILSYQEMIL